MPQPKTYPPFGNFCEENDKGNMVFKPALVAQWLKENEHIKTDEENGLMYYGDNEKGVWLRNGEVYLQKTLTKILVKENRVCHYANILHALKGLTYEKVQFSKKIAVENGLLDVETGQLTKPTLTEMAFHSMPVKYDPIPLCPNWLGFLKQTVNVDDIPTLQEWSGYLLLPDYRFHKIMWINGGGRNGKGVWTRTMEGILGQANVSHIALDEFDGNHRFALNQLYGKLFNPCSEPQNTKPLQTELLKYATGQDMLDAERKGSDKRLSFCNTAKITVLANKFPRVYDNTTAFRERRLVLNFPNEFTGKNMIANLEQVWLNDPQERSGILNWMLEGLQRLLSNGVFTESKNQQENEIQFQRASDTIGAFLTEQAEFNSAFEITRKEAFEIYMDYCETNRLEPDSEKHFTQRLRETPRVKMKQMTHTLSGKQERGWTGLTIRKIPDSEPANNTDNTGKREFTPQLNWRDSKRERE